MAQIAPVRSFMNGCFQAGCRSFGGASFALRGNSLKRGTAPSPQSFFRTTSPRMCLSSVRTGTRRLRRAFSSRSCRSSPISVSPSLAYFFFHR